VGETTGEVGFKNSTTDVEQLERPTCLVGIREKKKERLKQTSRTRQKGGNGPTSRRGSLLGRE